VVINSDMKVLPAAVQLAAAASIGTNHDAGEASQLLTFSSYLGGATAPPFLVSLRHCCFDPGVIVLN
jgi:hypothetical protein